MNLKFTRFTENDVAEMTPLMKEAFDEDSYKHLGKPEGGPPGYDNGDFLRQWALHKESDCYKVELDGQTVGLITLFINSDKKNYLGNLFVAKEHQERGIGLEIWKWAEKQYSDTQVWKTDTSGYSKRNHHFYVNKCGFHIVRIKNPGNLMDENYIMEKVMC